ncbi:MAG: aspartate/glutamate racemase family protein [Candidatus Lokiarchaeota archaeon]|nr:aspartate/glutamate racemase family protein [Candidatus Lokiarchaeota archaeon]
MVEIASGRNNYGQFLGIIMLKTSFTRIPGDIGNASTFDFPVRYKVIEEATPIRVVDEADRALLPHFIAAARDLEAEGVRATTTSCGFMALFQNELANAVDIPVFTSSLLQVPLACRMLREGKRVGIVTGNSKALTEDHLGAVGITDSMPIAIVGMEHQEDFTEAIGEHLKRPVDPKRIEKIMISVCRNLKKKENLGAIVFECTNLSPYAKAVQDEVGLPVYDITTLCNYAYSVTFRSRFEGFL